MMRHTLLEGLSVRIAKGHRMAKGIKPTPTPQWAAVALVGVVGVCLKVGLMGTVTQTALLVDPRYGGVDGLGVLAARGRGGAAGHTQQLALRGKAAR